MGYEITYDRCFIQVGDLYIPLFQSGSNNCTEFNWAGREVSEKRWCVYNYTKRETFLFTEDEIRALAGVYGALEMFKSRHRHFAEGEFARWFLNGMKAAQPLEFYTELGNTFYIWDYTHYEYGKTPPEKHCVKTTPELLELLRKLEGRSLEMGFTQRKLYLPRKPKTRKERKAVSHFFVLAKAGQEHYLCKLTRYGYRYTSYPDVSSVKKFATEKQAQSYLEKYRDRFSDSFGIKRIDEEAYL